MMVHVFLGIMKEDAKDAVESSSCSEYFNSYDNLEVHRLMISDAPRTVAYRDAIMNNADFIKGKVVMGK